MAMPSADSRLRLRPASRARQSQNSRDRRGGISPPPHCPLRRLLTGSCLAAPDAGSQPEKSPGQAGAAGRVQSVACQGTAAGEGRPDQAGEGDQGIAQQGR